ncbi:MAG TPA: hypothetical protein VF932_12640, partial [Anaerolineae bacterium]
MPAGDLRIRLLRAATRFLWTGYQFTLHRLANAEYRANLRGPAGETAVRPVDGSGDDPFKTSVLSKEGTETRPPGPPAHWLERVRSPGPPEHWLERVRMGGTVVGGASPAHSKPTLLPESVD